MARDPLHHLADALAGRYEPLREIGRGGAAIVYLARDIRHERQVALKVLRPELAVSLGADRFLREIKIAAGLNHPHILSVHDSGDADGILYYVMPYVEGETLRDRLARGGPLSVDAAVHLVRGVADALAYAHAHGVVHRDIKPGNILLIGEHALVADFGIATAIGPEEHETLTDRGLVVGTPAYMSPEQAGGAAAVDGRSDLYSLGCVFYEMLVGRPPFGGTTPQSLVAGHLSDPPVPARTRRPSIPVDVDHAISRLLQKLPADRFGSASQLLAALPADSSETEVTPHPVPVERRPVRRIGVVAAVLVLIVATLFARVQARPRLDGSLYVVLPFRHRGETPPPLLDGDQCGSLLDEALRRWNGIAVVDPLWVSDVRARSNTTPFTLERGVALARERGAGGLISGEVWQFGDSVFVRGVLYDVQRGGKVIRQHTVVLARDLHDARTRFGELASTLLSGMPAADRPVGTASLVAWQAFDAGHRAMLVWDLVTARRQLGLAVTEDQDYARANLGLATVLSWTGERESDWHSYAAAAVRRQEQLDPSERQLATGLLYLSERRYPESCAVFRDVVLRDSVDFAGWFGLGECLSRDRLVVADPQSRSGYRFRSSYAEAAAAYRRALEAYPSVHRAVDGFGLRRLANVLFTESSRYRLGYRVGPDTAWYGAFPSMEHDSIEFVPYPVADVLDAKGDANPASNVAAVDYARDVLRSVTTTWLRAFPRSPDVLEAHALVLETQAALGDTANLEHSALGAVVRARALSRDTTQALRLAVVETRLRLKLGQFGMAYHLADSLLEATTEPSPEQAELLAGLAALTGRPLLTADLMEATVSRGPFEDRGEPARVPPPLAESAARLFAFAAIGAPPDSIRAGIARTTRLMESYAEASRSAAVREVMLERSLALAFPVLGKAVMPAGAPPRHYILRMEAALAAGNTADYRRQLAEARAARAPFRPGDYSIDAVWVEAANQLRLGDTADATHLLDLSLNALPTLGGDLITHVPQAAGIPRAMALRADLAAKAGDRATAARWGSGVAALWQGAEPVLKPTAERMRRLAAGG